jgi:hypothetical protein
MISSTKEKIVNILPIKALILTEPKNLELIEKIILKEIYYK